MAICYNAKCKLNWDRVDYLYRFVHLGGRDRGLSTVSDGRIIRTRFGSPAGICCFAVLRLVNRVKGSVSMAIFVFIQSYCRLGDEAVANLASGVRQGNYEAAIICPVRSLSNPYLIANQIFAKLSHF